MRETRFPAGMAGLPALASLPALAGFLLLAGLLGPVGLGCAERAAGPAGVDGQATCLGCHDDPTLLEASAVDDSAAAWAGALVSAAFLESSHGKLPCVTCHRGRGGVGTKAALHAGLIKDPAAEGDSVCAGCHRSVTELQRASLHGSQRGMLLAVARRAGRDAQDPEIAAMFAAECRQCHASCGQCHISRPAPAGGGLLAGHAVVARPEAEEACLGCHADRIAAEFTGAHDGLEPDVHRARGMDCYDCHGSAQPHGDGIVYDHRYDAADLPTCAGCHPDAGSSTSSNFFHRYHAGRVQCQVCHSQAYANCYGCHVGGSAPALDASALELRIGRNPAASVRRPWGYVLVRHVPVAPSSFAAYGIELPAYEDHPTWAYTSPHNIRPVTQQGNSCSAGACHRNAGIYLTEAYILERIADGVADSRELEANRDVIVDDLP